MRATTLSVEDVKNLVKGKLVLQMPDFNATVAARNQVSYVRRGKDFPKGMELKTSTVKVSDDEYEFSVMVESADMKN